MQVCMCSKPNDLLPWLIVVFELIDVMIVAGAINCATQTAVQSIRKISIPPPRNIHLILPAHVVPVCNKIWE